MEESDTVQSVKDAVEQGSENLVPPFPEDFKMPSIEQLLEVLEGMDMPDDEKQKLKESLQDQSKLSSMMDELLKPGFDIIPSSHPLMLYTILVAFIVIVVMFVFFGYKLYRSLTEKERKRQEKLKQKQARKKK